MADALETILTSTGSAGAIVGVLGFVIRHLQTQLTAARSQVDAVHDKRIADAQASAAKFVEVIHAQHESMRVMSRSLDVANDTMEELKTVLTQRLDEREEPREDRERRGADEERERQTPSGRRAPPLPGRR